ncbi:RidA family protein [Fibrella sp. WM1]|uniref:RidA family protein n=1 Tax=Fibrella musci TaxID=3242485 RepID=UPI0035221B89
MTFIQTPDAAPAAGHYSQAVAHNGLVYIAGLLPVLPSGEKLTDAPLARQVQAVLENLNAILTAAGSAPDQVLQVRVYVTDINDWTEVNRLYMAFFGPHKPARAVVPVPTLHYGLRLELEATAVCTKDCE